MSAPLECVELEPKGPARTAVIWLHGLGADGHDFPPLVPHLGLPEDIGARFVFPHAPRIPVTINGGMVMRAWYDITSLDLHRRHDERGVRKSAEHVRALIEREQARGIEARRIVLAGFSMGGAIALHVGLRYPERLAGILALSTYLVLGDTLAEERGEANLDVPIFQAHGEHDAMVAFERGLAARDALRELGYPVSFKSYPMQHEVCLEEAHDAGSWLGRRLAEALSQH
jgi:phospholipase/carboxylesterase